MLIDSLDRIQGPFESSSVMHFAHSDPNIGLAVRKPKDGPEQSMVMQFIESMTSALAEGEGVAVFREPRVEGSFPDIVIATFDSRLFNQWPADRQSLSVQDIKILHSIHGLGAVTLCLLESRLGFDSRQLIGSLNSLIDAGLISRSGDWWTSVPINESFGIRRLIAVEAKMSDRRSVFLQARRNTWYASESYVLVPKTSYLNMQAPDCSTWGIGVFTLDCGLIETLVQPTANPLPSSYVSWLFNEWIGRSLEGDAERG